MSGAFRISSMARLSDRPAQGVVPRSQNRSVALPGVHGDGRGARFTQYHGNPAARADFEQRTIVRSGHDAIMQRGRTDAFELGQ
jgi:hypothetical protein